MNAVALNISEETEEEMDDREDVLVYCVDCLSLDIRYDQNNCLYCNSCGATAEHLDFQEDIWDWMKLYAKRYKKSPLPYKTPYDDLKDTYDEETAEVETEANAYDSGLTVMDVMQRSVARLDRK